MRVLERDPSNPIAARNTDLLNHELEHVRKISRRFVDATAASVNSQLPDGNNTDFDFIIAKTDVSANTVTILPYGSQTIIGGASCILATRYDCAFLVFDKESQTWFLA